MARGVKAQRVDEIEALARPDPAASTDKDLLCSQMLYWLSGKKPSGWWRTAQGRELDRRRTAEIRKRIRREQEEEFFARQYRMRERLEEVVETETGFSGWFRRRNSLNGRIYHEEWENHHNPHSPVGRCLVCKRVCGFKYTVSGDYVFFVEKAKERSRERRYNYTKYFHRPLCFECHKVHGPRDQQLRVAFDQHCLLRALEREIRNAKRNQDDRTPSRNSNRRHASC